MTSLCAARAASSDPREPVGPARPVSNPARHSYGPDRFLDIRAYAVGTRMVGARRTVHREGDAAKEFGLVLAGWAFQFKLLPNGRRQILSIVLPGEPVALHTLWADRLGFSVQSLTELQLCLIDRRKVMTDMAQDGALATRLGQSMARECAALEAHLINLGQRTAIERVARLILYLHARLKQREPAEGDSFPFPLRQQHVADALGMTPVHVSRVFSELRAAALIERTANSLSILDYGRLVEVAGP